MAENKPAVGLESKLLFHSDETIIPRDDGSMQKGHGPVSLEGKAIPTCTVCEKVLIAEMRAKYPLFNFTYEIGHAFTGTWLYFGLPKEERIGEEDNAVRKCRTCEKVYYRRMRMKSPLFDKYYKVLDATIEGWIDKFLSDDDRERAFGRDPAHARALIKFNPRNYYLGEKFILGIKFDGCIARETGLWPPEEIGEPIENVKELLSNLKQSDVKIILYGWRSIANTRGNPHYRKKAEQWMKAQQIPYDFFYDGKGPLIADAFISKRNLGGSLAYAYPLLLGMINDPKKSYLSERHVL